MHSRRKWLPTRRVAGVAAVMGLAVMGDSFIYVALPLHAGELGLSLLQVGVLLSANRFVRIVTNRVAAWVMHRSASIAFVSATVLAAVTTAMYGLTPTFLPLLAARLAWGLCFSTIRLGCFAAVLEGSTPINRAQMMASYSSISKIGSLVAVLLGGALLASVGYHSAFLWLAVASALAVPVAVALRPRASSVDRMLPEEAPEAGLTPEPTVAMGHDGRPLPSLAAVKWAAFTFSFVVRGVLMATLALFIERKFGNVALAGFSVAVVASWLIAARWATDIGLAPILGAFSDRLGRRRSTLAWSAATIASMLGLLASQTLAIAVVAAIVMFATASGLQATLDAAAGDIAEHGDRHRVMASYSDWVDAGSALGPLVALGVADRFSLSLPYALGVVLLVSSMLAFREGESSKKRSGIRPALVAR